MDIGPAEQIWHENCVVDKMVRETLRDDIIMSVSLPAWWAQPIRNAEMWNEAACLASKVLNE